MPLGSFMVKVGVTDEPSTRIDADIRGQISTRRLVVVNADSGECSGTVHSDLPTSQPRQLLTAVVKVPTYRAIWRSEHPIEPDRIDHDLDGAHGSTVVIVAVTT